MKRLFALILVLVLCTGLFAVPAGAAVPTPTPTPATEPEKGCIKFLYDENNTLYNAFSLTGTDIKDRFEGKDYINLSEIYEVEDPVKSGYTFQGWFYKDGTRVWSIPKKDVVDTGVILYARWSQNPPASTPAPTPTPEPTPTPNPFSGEGAAIIAATATDAGGGEITKIDKGDRFNLVVKMVDHSAAQFHVPAGDIAARLNSAAFTFTGTAEVGQLFEQTDPVTGTLYYSYVLIFRDIIYNGGGNEVTVNISYLNTTLAMQEKTIPLAQCAEAGPEASPEPGPRTNLMVRESSYGSSAVTAGTPFTLNVTVFATSGDESLADVIASVTLPKGITLTGGSLTQYIGAMAPGSTVDVQFQVLPSAAFTDGVADLTVHLAGTGAKSGNEVSGEATISVPVLQPDRFEISGIDCSDTVYVGQGGSITVNFVNKGRNVVANLEAEITGNNLGVDIPRVYVGNVNAGTENSVDFSLYPETPGPMDGTITLTYESEDGTVKTLTETFSATAAEMENFYDPGFMEDPGMMEEPPKAGLPIWGWVLIALAVVGAIVAAVVLVRRRKKAKALAALGEADDEDF